MTRVVAALALETGISPVDLLATPVEVFMDMVDIILQRKGEDRKQGLLDDLRAAGY